MPGSENLPAGGARSLLWSVGLSCKLSACFVLSPGVLLCALLASNVYLFSKIGSLSRQLKFQEVKGSSVLGKIHCQYFSRLFDMGDLVLISS